VALDWVVSSCSEDDLVSLRFEFFFLLFLVRHFFRLQYDPVRTCLNFLSNDRNSSCIIPRDGYERACVIYLYDMHARKNRGVGRDGLVTLSLLLSIVQASSMGVRNPTQPLTRELVDANGENEEGRWEQECERDRSGGRGQDAYRNLRSGLIVPIS